MKKTRLAAAGLATALALAEGTAAQTPEPYRFGEVVDVQLVNVEAWVTDRNSEPVPGLVAADFEVLEDGKPVEITYFAEIGRAGEVPVPAAATPAPAPAPAAPGPDRPDREEPSPPSPATEPNYLVLYFDQLHLGPAGRRRLIADVRDFLDGGPVAAERVLVLNQTMGLTAEATFGSTREEIEAALDRVAKSPPLGSRVQLDKRQTVERLQKIWEWAKATAGPGGDPCTAFVRQAGPEIERHAQEFRQRISVTLDHLASAASFLTGVPGVKTLLYVSDSLERVPGSDLLGFVRGVCPARGETTGFVLADELSRPFGRLTRHANANRVTIYSLQASGLRASFIGSAAQGYLDPQGTRGLDTAVRFTERDGMGNLAAETGGRAIFNRNDFDVELAEIGREMTSYYSLAYEPPHGGDELEHRIEVRVRDPRLRVRHRLSYRDKSPDTRLTERLQGAVYLGVVDNPLGVRLGAGAVRAAEKGRITVPLHIMVPAASVAFLPEGETLAAHLSVQVATRDSRNDKGVFEHSAFRIRRSAEDDGELVSVVMELTLPAGVHLVAVGLRDDATRASAVVSTSLDLRAPAAAAG